MNSPPLEIRLLGGFAVRVAGDQVPASAWQQRRAAAVVKLLALQPQRRLHREVLMQTLWPDLEGEAAANNLRVAMHRARQRLEESGAPAGRFLTRQQDDVVLGKPTEVWVDVDAFSQAAQRAWLVDDSVVAQLAAERYAGDLLPEDPYEEWAVHRRTDLRISFLALLSRLSQLHSARGDHTAAIAATQRLLAVEPLDESAHASLMRLYAHVGAFQQSLVQYDALVALLERELDAEPDATTMSLRDEIRELALASANQLTLVVPVSAPEAPMTIHSEQSQPGSDLIGREQELAELARLLERFRLVTLVGTAGVGKTRLAESLLANERARGRAAQFVQLAAVSQPELFISALASAIGATVSETEPSFDAVVGQIGQSNRLLILDNFEQILEAAGIVADLLRACPRLTVVVTSRELLRLRAEHIYHVAPLALPESLAESADDLADYPAINLFLQRARSADPHYTPSDAELVAISEICQRLDGLPLAIELAAARLRVLPPVALLSHLAQPLPLLVGGPRDAPARQRTMRNAIAWSVNLLAPEAHKLFSQLACFPESFTLQAAREICDAPLTESPLLGPSLVDLLGDLHDKHLLRRGESDPSAPRYTMLTVIREYAAELLEASFTAPIVRAKHARYFQVLADEHVPLLTTTEAGSALIVLEQEHPNLRAALATYLRQGDGDVALRMSTTLWRFWWQRGHLSEGRSWIAQSLEATSNSSPSVRAAALDADGVLAFAQGDFTAARKRHEDALQLAHVAGDDVLAGRALLNLGTVADEQGLPEEAARYLEEALRSSRASGDQRAIAVALVNLGQVEMSLANYPRAAHLLNESAQAFRALGDPRSEAAILTNLGVMSLMAGDAAAARLCHERALATFRDLGDVPAETNAMLNLGHALQHLGEWDQADSLLNDALARFTDLGNRSGLAFAELHLGKLALLRDEHDRAANHLVRALEIAEESKDWVVTAESLEGLAMLMSETGVPLRAAQTLGAAEAVRESFGLPLPVVHRPALAACLHSLELALPSGALAEARLSGAEQFRRRAALIEDGPATTLLAALSAGVEESPA